MMLDAAWCWPVTSELPALHEAGVFSDRLLAGGSLSAPALTSHSPPLPPGLWMTQGQPLVTACLFDRADPESGVPATAHWLTATLGQGGLFCILLAHSIQISFGRTNVHLLVCLSQLSDLCLRLSSFLTGIQNQVFFVVY